MVKDHSDSERGNPPPPFDGLLFPISTDMIARFLLYDMEHWLECETA